ncbi:MAG: transcriptional regulator [Chloroflexi bacterium]|nr:transcriptional regulator [Chloroflexota bacterium]
MMTRLTAVRGTMHLSEIWDRASGTLVEFLPAPDAKILAEAMVAFANTDGGTIVVGWSPAGPGEEIWFEEDLDAALTEAQRLCLPPVKTEWRPLDTDRGQAVAVLVSRSPELHSLADGRVLVRAGGENRPLGGEEIRQLAATKSTGDFEVETVPGASRADLSDEIVAEYMEKRSERQRRPLTGPVGTVLREISALDEAGEPTVTGLLLFGREPRVYLPQAGLAFVRFVGTEPKGREGLAGYGRREEINGPLPRLIEQAWRILWEEMRVEAVVRGLEREERTEYPAFAVREALVNAVCHRDYRLRGRRIEVRMFDDRLEITSPGGLPGYITLDNIVDEHFSRNPRLVSGLFQWGYIEELGLGIDRMIEAMVEAGHRPPHFRATPYSFTVTLFNVRERPAMPAWQSDMNERQLKALAHVQSKGRITNSDYRALCPLVSAETLRLDLVDLVDRGVLLRIGDKRGTYYILK